MSWLIYVCQQTHHSHNEFPEQIDSANFVTEKWGFRPHVESLNIFQYFGQKDSSNTPLPQVLLTNKLLQNERKQFNSPTAFPCVTNCNRNKHNNQDNGSCDDRNENWLGKSLMSRCRCLGHVYKEKYKIIIIKILYSVKIAPCKGMRISKSEKLWLVVFGILGFGIRNTSRHWILILIFISGCWIQDSGFNYWWVSGFLGITAVKTVLDSFTWSDS